MKKARKVLIITEVFDKNPSLGREEKMLERVKEFIKNKWHPIILMPRTPGKKKFSKYNIGGAIIKVFRYNYPFNNIIRHPRTKKKNYQLKKGQMRKQINKLKLVWLLKYLFTHIIIPNSATKLGAKIVKNENIDLIYATNTPNWHFITGTNIKKVTKTPVLLEYREPWTEDETYSSRLDYFFEKRVISKADAIVTYAGGQYTEKHFIKLGANKKLFKLSYCGYMPHKYKNLKNEQEDKFTITYGGVLRESRNPAVFLKSMHLFINKNKITPQEFQIIFAGPIGKWYENCLKIVNKYKLNKYIQIKGRLPHKEYIRLINKSSLLLLLVTAPGKKAELSIPSKTWEYIAVKKPILLLGKKHWLSAKFLKKNKLGLIADMDDPTAIAKKIQEAYFYYKKGIKKFSPKDSLLKRLDRRKLIKQFCNIMEEVCNQNNL